MQMQKNGSDLIESYLFVGIGHANDISTIGAEECEPINGLGESNAKIQNK